MVQIIIYIDPLNYTVMYMCKRYNDTGEGCN